MGLLDRAKLMLQGRSPASTSAKTQYYHVACAEGHHLDGQRTDGYQALRCPTCGEGIFVLPRSPLPEPVAPAGGRARTVARPVADDARVALSDPPSPMEIAEARTATRRPREAPPDPEPPAQIEWVDEEPAAPPPAVAAYSPETSLADAPTGATAPARPRPAKPRPKVAEPLPEAVPAGMIEVRERPTLREWAGRRRNPLIFAGVVGLVLLTFLLRDRHRRLDELPKVAELGRVQGLAKLDGGDFHVAKKILADAASAVDALGNQYEGADAIRQGAREAAIFADLVKEPLGTLIEAAARYEPPDAWPSHFDAIYRGQSILIEAQVTAAPDPNRPGSAYDIDYRIYYGNATTPAGRGRIDFKGFRLFDQAGVKVGDIKVFGARLASITLDVGSGEYLVGLEPDSGVFITHYRALEAIGWPAADDDREKTP